MTTMRSFVAIALFGLMSCGSAEEMNRVQHTTGTMLADGFMDLDRMPEWDCVDKLSARIEARLNLLNIDYKERILTHFANSDKLDITCKLYRDHLDELNSCGEDERLTPSALFVALQIACISRNQLLRRAGECLQGVEGSAAEKCDDYCTAAGQPVGDHSERYSSCAFAECTAKCIGHAARECEDSPEASTIYEELAGAQMLAGVETAFNGQSQLAHNLLRSPSMPIKCAAIISRALNASVEVPKLESAAVRDDKQQQFVS